MLGCDWSKHRCMNISTHYQLSITTSRISQPLNYFNAVFVIKGLAQGHLCGGHEGEGFTCKDGVFEVTGDITQLSLMSLVYCLQADRLISPVSARETRSCSSTDFL